MKLKKNSLKVKIWLYLTVFSISILIFLWLFQVIFLNSYYESVKTKDMNNITNKIVSNYNKGIDDFVDTLDELSFQKGVCIEVIDNKMQSYISNRPDRGCNIESSRDFNIKKIKYNFINSNETKESYKIVNNVFKNKTLISALKLDENIFAFVSVSLQPLDSTINVLKNQLIWVSIIVLILSFIIGYFISKKISKPIVKISKSATKLANKEYDTVFETGEDILELNELAQTLNYARDELVKTDELRRELMANVSHDLKTPLTMIKAYSEMVRDITYKDKEKREQNLNVIIEETDRLNLLVNDILDLSKMESGILELNIEKFNLVELVNDILKRYEILGEKENYKFIFEYDKDAYINADKKRIEQVIYNLINNAINYTGEDKTVKIKISHNKTSIRFEVSDSGIGINKEDIDLIWDKYYKVDKTHSRNIHGTGLGLSIVKNILIKHNFEYGVTSKKNKGTTFYFIVTNKEGAVEKVK